MMYRAWFYRNGIRDPTPSGVIDHLLWLIEAVVNALPEIEEGYPDVTEVIIEDEYGVEWFRLPIKNEEGQSNEF